MQMARLVKILARGAEPLELVWSNSLMLQRRSLPNTLPDAKQTSIQRAVFGYITHVSLLPLLEMTRMRRQKFVRCS